MDSYRSLWSGLVKWVWRKNPVGDMRKSSTLLRKVSTAYAKVVNRLGVQALFDEGDVLSKLFIMLEELTNLFTGEHGGGMGAPAKLLAD